MGDMRITDRLLPYLNLIRWDRPAGWLLLLWPTWMALWLAAGGFPQDRARRKALFPHAPTGQEHLSPAPETNTGDGLRLAEALIQAGLPVLSQPGNSFSARSGAGLVAAAGIKSLVVPSLAEYTATAVRLGNAPKDALELKHALKAEMSRNPVFNPTQFFTQLQRAFDNRTSSLALSLLIF